MADVVMRSSGTAREYNVDASDQVRGRGRKRASSAKISLMADDDPRVLRTILSIQGQILVCARPLPPSSPAAWISAASDPAVVADHIADFSVAALRALAAPNR